MNDSREELHHPVNLERRPVNYTSSGNNEINKEHRKLRIYVNDMVQVIDSKSHLCGKFGLVEELHPRNPQYQVIVKIGPIRNPLKFSQLKFCTRISPTNSNGLKINNTKCETEENNIVTVKVSDYIDEIDEEDENSGNRAGMNEKHGIKL